MAAEEAAATAAEVEMVVTMDTTHAVVGSVGVTTGIVMEMEVMEVMVVQAEKVDVVKDISGAVQIILGTT